MQERILTFEQVLQRQDEEKEQLAIKRKEDLQELQESFEERNNSIISKIEELKRKETLLITLRRIEPEIPESFPKNYFCQLVYEGQRADGYSEIHGF